MRFYRIELGNGKVFTSLAGGGTDPGALNVEIDITATSQATPIGSQAFVRIWGISLDQISQASDLNNQTIKVFGGFAQGLPLANPAQQGLLAQGYVFQAFGNWIGTDMTLDLVINPGPGPKTTQPNIVLNWKKGTPLKSAIQNTLNTAYPGLDTTINISDNLTLQHDEIGYYTNLQQFATYIRRVSRSIQGATAPGVDIVFAKNQFNVYDQTQTTSGQAKQILFTDLIGQPTWIDSPTLQVKVAMRGDLDIGMDITMPPTIVTNTQQAQSSLINQKASFQGGFKITSLRHLGNFRQSDAASWVTIFDAAPKNVVAQQI